MIYRGASPTDLQSRATDVQVSSHVAGFRRATRFEQRKASGQSVVVVQIFQVAGSASSGIQYSVDDAAMRQMAEGTIELTRCVLVDTESFAVAASMWEKLGSVDAKQWPKVGVH